MMSDYYIVESYAIGCRKSCYFAREQQVYSRQEYFLVLLKPKRHLLQVVIAHMHTG